MAMNEEREEGLDYLAPHRAERFQRALGARTTP
jgi:hypothetical protein